MAQGEAVRFDPAFCKSMRCESRITSVMDDGHGEPLCGRACETAGQCVESDLGLTDCRLCMEQKWRPEVCIYSLERVVL